MQIVERRRAHRASADADAPVASIEHGCGVTPSGSGSASTAAPCSSTTPQPGIRHHVAQPLGRILRIERHIGAAGLAAPPAIPTTSLERALGAHPDQHVRARRPGPAGDAPAGWRGRRARRSSACGPRTPPRPHPACAPPARQTAPAGVAAGNRLRRVVPARAGWCRARPAPGSAGGPAAAPASATAASSSRIRRAAQRLDRRLVEQVGGVFQHAVDARPACRRRAALDQPDRQVELRARGRDRLAASPSSPGSSSARLPAPASNASITWNSGCRDSDRAGLQHLDQPLERQVLVAVGRQVAGPAPARSARGSSGCPTCRCAAPGC